MGRISKIHPIILLLLILLLISFGCNRTGEPPLVVTAHRSASKDSGSGIQAPLFTSTSTAAAVTTFSTPSPTPRIDPAQGLREWMPSPILIQAGTIHDQKRDPFDRDPFFILYADGTLIQKDCADNSCDYTSAQINTKQICSLLNTIDLYGFFDYDPSSYVTPLVGGEITYLEVNAWRNQSIALYQLQDWLEDPDWLNRILGCDDCRKAPEI
ncbi:MAG: hypothetical protein JW704_01990, partial [Anaerolineaceae bacterium]|nr:hypothetical protein [Anaerolineaceae bacterium]